MATADSDSPNELRFPLSDSNGSLIEHPSQQLMDPDTNSEDGLGYLSDSTYEIISQSSFQASDSEDEAVNTPHDTDDTASVVSHATSRLSEDTDSDSDMGGAYSSPSAHPQPQPQAEHGSFDEQRLGSPGGPSNRETTVYTPQDSEVDELLSIPSLTTSTVRASAVTSTGGSHSLEDWIRFQEPMTSVADGLLNVSDNSHGHAGTAEHIDESVTLIHTLASHNLELGDGPFRIMYHGDTNLKAPIIQKISQALRISSWKAAEPKIVGEPSQAPEGVLLEVFECHCRRGLTFVPESCQNFFESSTDMCLAVFVHPQQSEFLGEASSATDLATSLDLARRCHVPRIDITVHHDDLTPYRNMHYRPYGGVAVHCGVNDMILSKELPVLASPMVVPVDVEMFLGLDSATLNRNLAKMFEHHQSRLFSIPRPLAHALAWANTPTLSEHLEDGLWNAYVRCKDIMTTTIAASLDRSHISIRQRVVPFVKKYHMEIFHTVTGLLFCLTSVWLFCSISTLLGRSALSASNSSMPDWSNWVTMPDTPYTLPTASSFEDMLRDNDGHAKKAPIVRVTTSSEVALATVRPETGLSIVTTPSKPRSWLSRTKEVPEPEWQLFQTNDSGRLLLQNRDQLPDLILLNMTMAYANRAILFNTMDNTSYFPESQTFMRTSLSRVDQYTLQLQLAPFTPCGSYNVSVEAFPKRQGRHTVHLFVISSPCQRPWLIKEATELATAFIRILHDTRSSLFSKLPNLLPSSHVTVMPVEHLQSMINRVPVQLEQFRQNIQSGLSNADIPAKATMASHFLMAKLRTTRTGIRAKVVAVRKQYRDELKKLGAKIRADEEERRKQRLVEAARKKLKMDAVQRSVQRNMARREELIRSIVSRKKQKMAARAQDVAAIPIKKARNRAVVLKGRLVDAVQNFWEKLPFDHRLVRYMH